jgi:predicted peptidase
MLEDALHDALVNERNSRDRLSNDPLLGGNPGAGRHSASRPGQGRDWLRQQGVQGQGRRFELRSFRAHDYKGDKEYPLILFLHGAGERGDDGEAPVKQGIGNAIKFKGGEQKFPFFVIFPQCAKGGSWKAGGSDADRALAMLDEVQKQYKIDGKRIYLTGLSMGGGGTWSLAAAYPDRWAAVAPICGGGDPANASKIKDIPCWAFCGDADKGAMAGPP